MKTNIIFKSFMAAIALVATVGFSSCSNDDDDNNNTTSSVKLSKSSVSVAVGKKDTILIGNGTKPYTAKSSDEKAVTAIVKTATATTAKDTLVVTGVKAGKASVLITDKNKKTASLSVTVK